MTTTRPCSLLSTANALPRHRASFTRWAGAFAVAFAAFHATAQAGPGLGTPPAVIPLNSQAPAELHLYPPVAEALARGVVILQFRTENFRVFPVFGTGALGVSPRIGHLHVTVDGMPPTWAHTSSEPIIVVGLKPGLHEILVELADPSHGIVAAQTARITVPDTQAGPHPTHR